MTGTADDRERRRYGAIHSGGVHNIIVEKEGISLIYPNLQDK